MSVTDTDIETLARGLRHAWADLPLVEVIQNAMKLGAELALPKQSGLTPKQAELLTYMRQYVAEHGYAPTYAQMLEAVNLHSKSGIHRLLNGLEERGYIRRTPNRRQAIVLYGSDAPPQIDVPKARVQVERHNSVREAALRYYGKASASEIAKKHGVTRNSIIGHWFRLRQAGLLPRQTEAA